RNVNGRARSACSQGPALSTISLVALPGGLERGPADPRAGCPRALQLGARKAEVAGGSDRDLARVQLGDRGLGLVAAPAVLQPRGAQVGQARVLHADPDVGHLELERLVRADRSAERLALARVADALLETAPREPGRERGDRDPPVVEGLEELGVAAPSLAEQVRLRHPASRERDLAGVARPPSDLA